jgi:BirA family biotin operon repressor/biotin-[acetyl-CoA-carboxylase] ligase
MSKLGSRLLRYESLPSTNDLAGEMAGNGAEEGLAITAETQTSGRGRLGREWRSPRGEGLYLSLVLRPNISPRSSSIITLAAAVAVAETLIFDLDLPADIKWPNDVLVRGRKICGILAESSIEADRLQHVILGIGVNISQAKFPEDMRQTATSVFIESERTLSCDDLLSLLLERLDHWYRLAISNPARVIARCEDLSSSARSCRVRITSGDREVEAVTRGIAPSGALVIETPEGERREVFSGEVTLRKE